MSNGTESSHAQLRRSNRGRDLALWTSAALLVFVAHAGAAYMGLFQRAEEAISAPQAVVIDLEPLDASEMQNAEQENAEQAAAALEEPQPVEDPEPTPTPPEEVQPEPLPEPEPEQAEPEPVEEVQEEVETPPEEIVNQELAQLDDAAVPLPMNRPELPRERPVERPVRETKREEPRRQVERPQRQERPRETQERPRTVQRAEQGQSQNAQQSVASRARSVSPRRYTGQLVNHIRKFREYPANANSARGETYVRFSIDAGGRVTSASVARSSGSDALDQAAVATVRKASPVPAPPEGMNRTFNVPIDFRRGR